MSQSLLKVGLNVSWSHVREMLAGRLERETTDSLLFGSAVHAYLFEPDSFATRFPVAQPCSAVLKSGARSGAPCLAGGTYYVDGAWLCGKHAPADAEPVRDALSQEQFVRVRELATAVLRSPAAKLLWHPGGEEVAWTCLMDGVPMKGKIDRLCPPSTRPDGGNVPGVILDVKKIPFGTGALPDLVRRISRYAYDLQAACYQRAVAELTGERYAYVWLFVEDQAPYSVAAVQASSAMMELGYRKLSKSLAEARDCLSSGYWPGYADCLGDDLVQVSPAGWELRSWGLNHLCDDLGDLI